LERSARARRRCHIRRARFEITGETPVLHNAANKFKRVFTKEV
jgi:hypothetical protein